MSKIITLDMVEDCGRKSGAIGESERSLLIYTSDHMRLVFERDMYRLISIFYEEYQVAYLDEVRRLRKIRESHCNLSSKHVHETRTDCAGTVLSKGTLFDIA